MQLPQSLRYLAWAAFAASTAQANTVVDGLSFGHKDTISSNHRDIPGWRVSGEGHDPQILSDRVILTPPAPGNKRGALWANSPLDKDEYVMDFEFRASGQDRGNGNLQIWLTQGGQPSGGISSIYTVGQFDGLVLSIDQYGGQGGKVRGFLNDGTVSFKDHHSVDSLAFGQCDYRYRNRGEVSRMKVTQTGEIFSVEMDGQTCFTTNQVRVPAGYYFGISAASAENPDSFEAWKFIVATHELHGREEVRLNPPPVYGGEAKELPVFNNPEKVADAPASNFKSQEDQFRDLHDRVQVIGTQVDNIFRLLDDMRKRQEEHHHEAMTLNKNGPIHAHVEIVEKAVGRIEAVIGKIEGGVSAVRRDLEGKDYKEHLSNLQSALRDTHAGITDHVSNIVTTSAPKMWTFVFLVVIFQVVMFGGYLVYKRRRDSAPKKYL
ncbi:uncharacterized protein K452DRAFT_2864 [Aplosporella prunicola CBS 121167]|uniref:L-type lectin-like domain-containing protein n=1 Tax=Aplosporella prunicola CBS 121167 TaxID=1176127 RepID=A0A6A6BSV7_9PEZI|nr:uncharacterized protein K452DRAFT_2864 [Aplosporella prunicola CBS 121167]KAF2147176.1 hypothetical protein K452DRAFT_2864 [Aplosporella prunicola CBS 121167]